MELFQINRASLEIYGLILTAISIIVGIIIAIWTRRKGIKTHTHKWVFRNRIGRYAEHFYETHKDVTHRECYCKICGETWVKRRIDRNHWMPIRGLITDFPYVWEMVSPPNERFDKIKNRFDFPDHSPN